MDTTIQQPALELRNVSMTRGGRRILDDISWCVPHGASAAILGPNGSGKSTLARILTGYMWPTSGEVFVNGEHFGEVDLNELRRGVRLVQSAGPYDVDEELTTRQAVLTGLFGTIGLFDKTTDADATRAEKLLARVGLSAVVDSKYATLSSGERVRTLIARSLMIPPMLLLLDEPTAGLDLLAREQVLATVEALLRDPEDAPTVVMITHHVEELPPTTSHVLLLDQGTIGASGSPDEVLTTERLSKVYRCPLRVTREEQRYYVRVDPSAWRALIE
jgi:iron complex transport system ATP-binding protein